MILLAALLQGGTVADLDRELRAATSATAVLQKRCPVPIRAEVDRAADKPAPDAVRADLDAGRGIELRYRLVSLKCGDVIYSRAENWYRPDRLTRDMNQALLSGETPFGVVIARLTPFRRTLGSEYPREEGAVLRHHAIVLSADGLPLAVVVETYERSLPVQMSSDR